MWYDPCDPYFYDAEERQSTRSGIVWRRASEVQAALEHARAMRASCPPSHRAMWDEEIRSEEQALARGGHRPETDEFELPAVAA